MADRLTPTQRSVLGDTLAPFADHITSVALFGSRATGKARANSDIDIVIYGALTDADIDRLWTLFDEGPLSVSVDVVLYDDRLYPPLKRHIDGTACRLFDQHDLQTA